MSWSRTNQLIIAAATELGVRAEPLVARHTDYFMRLATGSRQVIISKTRSPFLTQVAQSLANNKHVSRRLLRAAGIPCVDDILIDEGDDPEDAAPMLAAHGRVVVKPNWGNRGAGITSDVRSLAVLAAARERARAGDLDEEVVVEPYIPGTNVRVTVIGGRYVAAAEVVRPFLQPGVRIADQVAAWNRDPRRGIWHTPSLRSMDEIEAEEQLLPHLAVHGYDLSSVLPDGCEIEAVGEEAAIIDRTAELDPGWAAMACRACAHLGVDVGGVDLRGPLAAFMQPPATDGAEGPVVLEVNVLPALHLHALPTEGAPQPVFAAFVAYCLQLPGAPPPCAAVLA